MLEYTIGFFTKVLLWTSTEDFQEIIIFLKPRDGDSLAPIYSNCGTATL